VVVLVRVIWSCNEPVAGSGPCWLSFPARCLRSRLQAVAAFGARPGDHQVGCGEKPS